MNKPFDGVSKFEKSISYLLLIFSAGGVLATPLLSGPAVLLAVIASGLMVRHGLGQLFEGGVSGKLTVPPLLIGFGFWFVSCLILTLFHGDRLSDIENPLRFVVALGVFWILRRTGEKNLKVVLYSITTGAFIAAATALYQRTYLGIDDRLSGWTNNPIYFGSLSVLLCIYALIAILILRQGLSFQLRNLLTAALLLGIYANYSTQSRSSFIALISLLVLIGHIKFERRNFISSLLIVFIGLGIAFSIQPKLLEKTRIIETMNELQNIQQGDFNSSIGTRLQMWKGATLIFMQNPLVGVGSEQYKSEMKKLVEQGKISVVAILENGNGGVFNQPHSAIMEAIACRGLIGLAALILIFLLPFRILHNLSKSSSQEVEAISLMGMATVIAFFMFGLTNSIFRIQIYSAVYPISIAMFSALALNLKMNELPPKNI